MQGPRAMSTGFPRSNITILLTGCLLRKRFITLSFSKPQTKSFSTSDCVTCTIPECEARGDAGYSRKSLRPLLARIGILSSSSFPRAGAHSHTGLMWWSVLGIASSSGPPQSSQLPLQGAEQEPRRESKDPSRILLRPLAQKGKCHQCPEPRRSLPLG